jgi:hypothetical protein
MLIKSTCHGCGAFQNSGTLVGFNIIIKYINNMAPYKFQMSGCNDSSVIIKTKYSRKYHIVTFHFTKN